MDTSSDDAIRFPHQDLSTSSPTGNWYVVLFAVIMTLFTVYWGFVRPTSRQLTKLRRYVTSLEASIAELNGQQVGVQTTMGLLDQLIQQGQLTVDAENALAQMRQIHNRIIHESNQLASAQQAVENLANLRVQVARQSSLIHATQQALTSIEDLNEDVCRVAEETEEAKMAVENMAVVRDGLVESLQRLDEVKPLISSIDTVHSRIVATQSRADSAQNALDDLISIGDKIEAQAASIQKAETALDAMVDLQQRVVSNLEPTATAIETLELATDVQLELRRAEQTFQGMKRLLTEMSNMQPRLEQASRCLQPLTQLTELRRMSVQDLQRVAHVVRDRYLATIASEPDEIVADASEVPNVE